MAKATLDKGVSIEVLGTCTTNTTPGSQHDAKVEYSHLWSYAQQAALIAVSDKSSVDGCYHLIADPERRAKRIAAHYAWLYFESAKKSRKNVQFYWPALAAFVVKDIVEAYRFTREEVLHREWTDIASFFRNSVPADLGSVMITNDTPYQHALRTYSALAKGNLWLFMDIYPWLWFFLEYGINSDGSLNRKRLNSCLPERNWNTYQKASKEAIEELPYGPHWMSRLKVRLDADPVLKKARDYFDLTPSTAAAGGYRHQSAAAYAAHEYCRSNVGTYDNGYRTPSSVYWRKFKQAYYIMESEHSESGRIAIDSKAVAAIVNLRQFRSTSEVVDAYRKLISECSEESRAEKQKYQRSELVSIAEQEQINVLQSLIYDDALLKETMDINHRVSRLTDGWISQKFKVVYSAGPRSSGPDLETVFDAPVGTVDQLAVSSKSLPNAKDRLEFVGEIADKFNHLMANRREYMDGELRKISAWLNA